MSARIDSSTSERGRAQGPSTWPWVVLAVGGLLIAAGGIGHPHADTSLDYQHAVLGMLDESAWPITHALSLAGLIAVAVALFSLVGPGSAARSGWRPRTLTWARAACAATVLGVVEMVPHMLSFLQADELETDGSAPLLVIHTWIQFVSAPCLGVTVAGLAIASARRREFGNGWVMAIPAVVGGVAFAAAGVLMALTHDPAVSTLFVGAAGIALWLVVGGVRRALAEAKDRERVLTPA